MNRAVPRLFSIAIGVVAASCTRAHSTSPPSAASTVSRPAPAPSFETAANAPNGAAQRKIADFLARVAQVRHLEPRAPVEGREVDRATLIAGVREHVARELPADVLRSQGELLVGLGLVPPDFDYEEGTFKLLEAQVTGFYEYHDKMMYLATDLDGAGADQTLAHELVHALQDQHYDLAARIGYKPEENDREGAFQALAEGDATSAMIDAVEPNHHLAFEMPDDVFVASIESSMNASSVGAMPKVMWASLLAPYTDGVLFVHALRRRGVARGSADPTGWAEVDRAWHSPPDTTEQLLHLEKYDAHEPAEIIGAILPPSDGAWSAIYEDVFGEQGLRISVEQWMSKKLAARLADGWGGDRLAVFRRTSPGAPSESPAATPNAGVPAGSFAVAWHIRFDAGRAEVDGEARQAFKALSDALQPRRVAGANTFCVDRGAIGPLAVVRAGRDLALAAGPYEHQGSHVRSGAICAQTVRWAADILSKGKP